MNQTLLEKAQSMFPGITSIDEELKTIYCFPDIDEGGNVFVHEGIAYSCKCKVSDEDKIIDLVFWKVKDDILDDWGVNVIDDEKVLISFSKEELIGKQVKAHRDLVSKYEDNLKRTQDRIRHEIQSLNDRVDKFQEYIKKESTK